ncbi:MAG: hypothetical protein MUE50_03950 [Pirellulaceae bacterium]|nr:hypothetical protein [Pirellulaceae bacterium]
MILLAALNEIEQWLRHRTHHSQRCKIEMTVLPSADKSDFFVNIAADAEAPIYGHSKTLCDAFRDAHQEE